MDRWSRPSYVLGHSCHEFFHLHDKNEGCRAANFRHRGKIQTGTASKNSCKPGLRVRFFKKIQDWILKSEGIRKWILRFFTRQINPRSIEESSLEVDSSVSLTHHDPKDVGLFSKETHNVFSDSFRF